MINTAVVPLVGIVCSKHEVDIVIDSWSGFAVGLVEASDDESKVTSRVLWFHGAAGSEAMASAAVHQ